MFDSRPKRKKKQLNKAIISHGLVCPAATPPDTSANQVAIKERSKRLGQTTSPGAAGRCLHVHGLASPVGVHASKRSSLLGPGSPREISPTWERPDRMMLKIGNLGWVARVPRERAGRRSRVFSVTRERAGQGGWTGPFLGSEGNKKWKRIR